MTDKVFGVDGNWYLHRVFHTQVFEPKDEALSQATRLLGMMCKDAAAVKAKRIFVAFDGNNIFRYKVYKKYKENRSSGSEVYTHLEYIKAFIKKAGIKLEHHPKYEADDWMRSLAKQWEGPVVLGCGDKDSYQGVREGVVLYNSATKKEENRWIDEKWIKREFGLTPRQFLEYQILIGDEIDCIPQLKAKANVLEGLREHGSIVNWAAADKGMRAWCKKNVDDINRNKRLVTLKSNLPIDVPPIVWNTTDKMTKSYYELQRINSLRTKGLF